MKHNVFDELNGLYADDDEQLSGLFDSIKKRVKKTINSVKKIRSKIADKILPNKIQEIGRKIDRSGALKVAAGLALGAVALPALGAGISTAGIKGLAAKGIGMASSGIKSVAAIGKTIKIGGAIKTVKAGAGLISTLQQTQGALRSQPMADPYVAANEAQNRARQVASELQNAMGQSPEFVKAVQQLKAQGYRDEDILQHWRESKSYYLATVPKVANAVYPQIYQTVATQGGFDPQTAKEVATAESYRVADQAVRKEQGQSGFDVKDALPYVAIAATFLLK